MVIHYGLTVKYVKILLVEGVCKKELNCSWN